MRWTSLCSGAVLLLAAVSLPVGSTYASGDRYNGSGTTYVGSGSQRGNWQQANRRLHLRVTPKDMKNTRCMDAFFDWRVDQPPVHGHNHYDSRQVRSCLPGWQESTDPGGDDFWSEGNWAGENPDVSQQGWGMVISDGPGLTMIDADRFPDAGGTTAPRNGRATTNNGSVRVRTRYQNLSVYSCNPLPANVSAYRGCD